MATKKKTIVKKKTGKYKKIVITISEKGGGSIKASTEVQNCEKQDLIFLASLALASCMETVIPDNAPLNLIREECAISGTRAAEMIITKKQEVAAADAKKTGK